VECFDEVVRKVLRVMRAPIPELPLRPEWGMGEYLAIGVDAKASVDGGSWAEMARLDLAPYEGVPETVSDAPALGVEDEEDEEMVESLGTVVGVG